MHDLSMCNQKSKSNSNGSAEVTSQGRSFEVQKGVLAGSHSLRTHTRPLSPPFIRDTVREEAKSADVYIDLTPDSDEDRPSKMRRLNLHNTDFLRTKLTPQAKEDSLVLQLRGHLVGYTISSSGSPENEHDDKGVSPNAKSIHCHVTKNSNDESIEPSVQNASQSQQHSKILPFIDEGYGSFSADQKNVEDSLQLTEEDLAEQLISSDKLRSEDGRLYSSTIIDSNSNSLNRRAKNAAAWKERIERDGVERSRQLREAASQHNGLQVNVKHCESYIESPPKRSLQYNREQVGILNIFGSLDSPKSDSDSRRESHSSGESGYSGGGTTFISLMEDDEERDDQYLFYGSQYSLVNDESCPDASQERIDMQPESNLPRSVLQRPASSRHNQTSMVRHGKTVESDSHQATVGGSDLEDDLEAGARKLKAFMKINERQKARLKTGFPSRHDLDVLSHPSPQRLPIHPSLPSTQKFYSPFGENVPGIPNWPFQDNKRANGKKSDSSLFLPVSNDLQKAQNRTGGLAVLAQKAGHVISNTSNQDMQELRSANVHVQRHYGSATVTAETFQPDFARYTQQLSQQ